MTLPPPEPLLPRVAQGDGDAVRACIDRYQKLVWSLVSTRLRGPEAEDLVQEVFIELWRSADRYRPELGSEVTFVATITRRRLIDRLRQKERQPVTNALPEQDDAELALQPAAEASAEAAIATRALRTLALPERRAVLLSVCHGLSHSEIAESLRLPLGTAKTYVRRGLMRVRERLMSRPALEEAL